MVAAGGVFEGLLLPLSIDVFELLASGFSLAMETVSTRVGEGDVCTKFARLGGGGGINFAVTSWDIAVRVGVCGSGASFGTGFVGLEAVEPARSLPPEPTSNPRVAFAAESAKTEDR